MVSRRPLWPEDDAPQPAPAFGATTPDPVREARGVAPTDLFDPAQLAALRAAATAFATADPLTATYDLNQPGMVELYESAVIPRWSRPFANLLLSQLLVMPRPPSAQVLDVACGPGFPTLEIARFLGQEADVVGLDPWEAAIDRGRRRAGDAWLRNVSFVAGDITHATLPERHFDLITCNLGYTSFADRGRALATMSRLARPGGALIMTVPLQAAMREFLDLYHVVLSDLQLTTSVDSLLALVKNRPTIASARVALERAGLVIDREVTDRFTLRFADPRDFLTSPVVALNFMAGWRAIVPDLALRRLVFNEVERRLSQRAAAEGDLAFDVPMLCLSARKP